MARYAISGVTVTLLDASIDGTGATVGDPSSLFAGRTLMGRNLPANRVLWLRAAWFYNDTAAVTVRIYDASDGVNATMSTSRFVVRCASVQTTMVDFPAPGIKFATGCVVARETSEASAALQAGYCGGWGYEEG